MVLVEDNKATRANYKEMMDKDKPIQGPLSNL